MEGVLSWIVSIFARVVVKIVVDFTLIVQLRHHNEFGAAYWSGNIAINKLFCLVSVYLYKQNLTNSISFNRSHGNNGTPVDDADEASESRCDKKDGNNDDYVCEESTVQLYLWFAFFLLLVCSMVTFGLLLLSINRSYLVTFYDPRSGKQVVRDKFHLSTSDVTKFDIFSNHPTFYEPIVAELTAWLDENWDKWEEEKPEWFSAISIARIPEDMLPVRIKNSLGGTKQERRDSLKQKIAEEARALEERES